MSAVIQQHALNSSSEESYVVALTSRIKGTDIPEVFLSTATSRLHVDYICTWGEMLME